MSHLDNIECEGIEECLIRMTNHKHIIEANVDWRGTDLSFTLQLAHNADPLQVSRHMRSYLPSGMEFTGRHTMGEIQVADYNFDPDPCITPNCPECKGDPAYRFVYDYSGKTEKCSLCFPKQESATRKDRREKINSSLEKLRECLSGVTKAVDDLARATRKTQNYTCVPSAMSQLIAQSNDFNPVVSGGGYVHRTEAKRYVF